MRDKTRRIIGLDLDGVIIDHTDNKIKLAKRFGATLTPQETASDVITHKLPDNVKRKIQEFLYDDPAFALTSPLVSGAMSGLKFLEANGFSYFLISRRYNPQIAVELLRKRHIWPEFFDEEKAYFVQTKEDKNKKAEELGVSIYIDDQPSVLDVLTSVRHKFLFDPLQAYTEFEGDYKKVHSWPEFIEQIKNLP